MTSSSEAMKKCSTCGMVIPSATRFCIYCGSKEWQVQGPVEMDEEGQLRAVALNARRRAERDISEMLGWAKGILADGKVSIEEGLLLRAWLSVHPECLRTWPASAVAARLTRIYEEGKVTDEERHDLAQLLSELVGGEAGIMARENAATSLPLDGPQPPVIFAGRTFVLMGRFVMAPRTTCERLIRERGGVCRDDVSRAVDYLVIGTFGSRGWIETSYGRKIEEAAELRVTGHRIAIISEDHWAEALDKR